MARQFAVDSFSGICSIRWIERYSFKKIDPTKVRAKKNALSPRSSRPTNWYCGSRTPGTPAAWRSPAPRFGAVAFGHFGRVGFDLVAAVAARHHEASIAPRRGYPSSSAGRGRLTRICGLSDPLLNCFDGTYFTL